MSTLKTNNLQHLDSGSANIELAIGGGAIHSGISTFNKVRVGSATTFTDELVVNGDARITGISTFNKVRVGSATTFTDDLVVNGDARITGILTIGTGSITLDPNNDEIKLGQTKLKRESDGEIKITDLQGNLKGLRGKRFRIQVTASEKNKNGVEVGTGATITSPNDNELSFRLNDQPRVKIDANGKVGIGTTVPNEALHIYTTSSAEAKIESTSNSGIAAITLKANGGQVNFGEPLGSNNRGRIQYSNAANTITGAAADRLEFFTNNDTSNSAILIQADNKVGISSNLPNASLEVNVADGDAGFRVRNTASGAGNNKFQVFARSSGDTDYHTVAYVHRDNYPLNCYTYAGTSYNYASVFAGRTRSNDASPVNYYRHGAHAFEAYSARTDDQQNYRSRIFMKAWDSGDDGDRNAIYYLNSGDDTTTVDYDQHQKFGIKANGHTQLGSSVWCGRVESDESTPNSVYSGSSGTGVIAYPGTSAQYTRIIARTTDNTDDVYKVDTGGGVVIKFQSDGNGRFDGGADIGAASDYAEYFEWADGNSSNEDRRGITVILDGEKIRPATDSDDTSKIIGVVSANPAVVGDSAWSEWQLAHLKDAYGSWVTEDKEYLVWNKFGTFTDTDGVKKPNPQPDINDYNMASDFQILVSDIEKEKAAGRCPQAAIDQNIRITRPSRTYNPDYDPSRDYVPRSQRREWDAIGLVGKLVVRRGQPIGSNWILMKSNVGVDPNDNNIILDRYLVR